MSSREFLGIFPLLSLKYRPDEEATKEQSRARGSAGRHTEVDRSATVVCHLISSAYHDSRPKSLSDLHARRTPKII